MGLYLLQNVQHQVGGLVKLVVVLKVGLLHLLLGGQLARLLDALHDRLGGHTARLGGEVDPLSRAFCHVAGSVPNKCHAANNTPRAVVLGDGMGLDLDDLATFNFRTGTAADGIL